MSSKKTAQGRLSLLAGTSLVAALLTTGTFAGAALAPTVALASDECTPANVATLTDGPDGVSDPSLNGTTADSFACEAPSYPSGITYTSDGNLMVTSGEIAVQGMNLTGAGGDNVNYTQTGGNFVYTSTPADAVIEVITEAGDIDVHANLIWDVSSGTNYGVLATSTGGGDISISAATVFTRGATAAVSAVTNGGDIDITTSNSAFGRLRGVLARTSGAGTITVSGGAAAGTGGIAAIDVASESGRITINTTGLSGGDGLAILAATTTGSVVVNNTGGIGETSFLTPTQGGAVDFSGVGGGVTFNNINGGYWAASKASVFSPGNDVLNMNGAGGNQFGPNASINFGAGNDTVNLGARLYANQGSSIDFGTGADTFNQSGVFSVDTLTIDGLEAFNNSGTIYIGAGKTATFIPTIDWTKSNLMVGDVLTLPGTTFTGSGDSRLVMDVLFGANEQANCSGAVEAADCLYLPGGSTAGLTMITLNDLSADAQFGAYTPTGITLVDLAGAGSGAAGQFVLDPNSTGYRLDPIFGGVIARPGLFSYALLYDPDTKRHALVGVPQRTTMEYAALPSAARSVWYMTSKAVTDRQTDMRAGTDGTVWVRAAGEYSKRDVDTGFENFGDTFTFDNSYKLYAGTIIGGMDLVSGTSGGYDYVVGAQLGYAGSSFDLNASDSSGRFTGATGGVYGSFWNSRLFFDGAFNTDFLTLDYDSPGLGSKTNTWLRSVGARGEAGMRYGLGERMYVEPLATAAFVYTTFEEISLAGGEVRPDDAQSRRAALGLRIGADYPGQSVNWSYFVTGRLWNEFAGDSRVVVKNPGADLIYADDFSGTFSEFEAGLSLANDAGTVSGFLTTGVKAQDGYSAVDLATGVRLRW